MPFLNIPIIAAAIAGLLSFTAAWNIQNWRIGSQISHMQAMYAQEQLHQQEAALETQTAIDKKYQQAFHAANERETALRVEMEHLRATRDRLRTHSADIEQRLATATRTTAIEYATAQASVLNECSTAITALAQQADGHTNDVRHLLEAWPAR